MGSEAIIPHTAHTRWFNNKMKINLRILKTKRNVPPHRFIVPFCTLSCHKVITKQLNLTVPVKLVLKARISIFWLDSIYFPKNL